MRQREAHKLRHVITKLLEYVPEEEKQDPLYQELAKYHCDTRMHVVRLLARALTMRATPRTSTSRRRHPQRWEAGYAETNRALERQLGLASSACSTA